MTRLIRILMIAAVAMLPAAAQANLVVTFDAPEFIPAGSEGYLDVFIHSDRTLGEPLQSFATAYDISAPGLTFFTDGSGGNGNAEWGQSNYVFAGDSGTSVGTVDNGLEIYNQNDYTLSGNDATVLSTDELLARLHFVATTPGSYNIAVDTSQTYFFPADPLAPPIQFSVANQGIVTVTSPSAVPEPSSFLLLSIGAATQALRYRKKSTTA